MLGLEWRIPLYREYGFYIRVCRNWREVIRGRREGTPFIRFHLRDNTIIEFTDIPPWVIFNDIWHYKEYTHWHRPRISPGVIVDIGANIGIFCLYAASLWPQADVWAYEPEPRNFRQLVRNAQLNPTVRITTIHAAASGKRGNVNLLIKQASESHSLYAEPGRTIEDVVEVSSVILEDIIEETHKRWIDFLKVDCEGAEYELLAGKEEILRDRVGYIVMEYHEAFGRTKEELSDVLAAADFKIEIHPAPRHPRGHIVGWNRYYHRISENARHSG